MTAASEVTESESKKKRPDGEEVKAVCYPAQCGSATVYWEEVSCPYGKDKCLYSEFMPAMNLDSWNRCTRPGIIGIIENETAMRNKAKAAQERKSNEQSTRLYKIRKAQENQTPHFLSQPITGPSHLSKPL